MIMVFSHLLFQHIKFTLNIEYWLHFALFFRPLVSTNRLDADSTYQDISENNIKTEKHTKRKNAAIKSSSTNQKHTLSSTFEKQKLFPTNLKKQRSAVNQKEKTLRAKSTSTVNYDSEVSSLSLFTAIE